MKEPVADAPSSIDRAPFASGVPTFDSSVEWRYRSRVAAFDLDATMARLEGRLARPARLPPGDEDMMVVAALPEEVREALLNLDLSEAQFVPADVVAYYAFNYGSSRALSYASALPLAALVRAQARSGWRPKSHALLTAVIRFRGQTP